MTFGPQFPFFDASVTNTVEQARSLPTKVSHVEVSSIGAADAFLQLFDALAADVTLGATAPTQSLFIPANGAMDKSWGQRPMQFDTALSYAITATATGAGAPASAGVLNLGLSSS